MAISMQRRDYSVGGIDEGRKRDIEIMAAILAGLHMQTADCFCAIARLSVPASCRAIPDARSS